MEKVLRLLELGKKYNILKSADLGYEIIDNENGLSAIIDSKNKITYYVTGAYNCGIDYLDINIKALDELREFVEKIEKSKNIGEI